MANPLANSARQVFRGIINNLKTKRVYQNLPKKVSPRQVFSKPGKTGNLKTQKTNQFL